MNALDAAAYSFLGLTAIVGALAAAMTFAVLRFFSAARDTRRQIRSGGGETAILAAALGDAVSKLKAQERATAARADASERLSEEIIASLTAGLLVVGLNGEVRILNPAGRRMLSVGETAPHQDYRRLLSVPALSQIIDECLKRRAAMIRKTVALPDRGNESVGMPGRTDAGVGANPPGASHIGVTVSPLFTGGELQGAICLFTDLTAVKTLEEQLQLKESLAVVGELTAGIAHEFRNGLATIHGYSKLFDLRALPEAYRPYVEGIRAETASLAEVVTNFLNFAKPATLTLSRVDLEAICERAAEEVRADVRALGGDVTVQGEFGTLDGDEVLLRQAFSNLLRNAVEACSEASRAPVIVIRSEIDPAQQVSRIAVDDNGPGIDVAARSQVFRPFFTSKRTGTGLGLALVQKIVVFHNGPSVSPPPISAAPACVSSCRSNADSSQRARAARFFKRPAALRPNPLARHPKRLQKKSKCDPQGPPRCIAARQKNTSPAGAGSVRRILWHARDAGRRCRCARGWSGWLHSAAAAGIRSDRSSRSPCAARQASRSRRLRPAAPLQPCLPVRIDSAP